MFQIINKYFLNKKWAFLFLVITFTYSVKAQDLKVTVTGGTVQFIVSSLSQYNNGVALNNWTRVRLTINNPLAFDGWRLYVRSLDPNIISDDSANPSLSLSFLRLYIPPASITSTSGTVTLIDGDFIISGSDYLFMQGDQTGDGITSDIVTFNISYFFGESGVLINVPWGFYHTQLAFTLVSIDK